MHEETAGLDVPWRVLPQPAGIIVALAEELT
jgi:hypothetical protein